MGPHLELANDAVAVNSKVEKANDTAQSSQAAPPGAGTGESQPAVATNVLPQPPQLAKADGAAPGPEPTAPRADARSLVARLLRDVGIATLPVLLINTPFWAIPRVLRPDLDFTAKEFRAECDANGESDWEDHGAAGGLGLVHWFIFTALIISVYYLLPIELFSPVEESEEALKKIRGRRHWWGAGYVFFYLAHFALRGVWSFQPNQGDGMIFLVGSALGLTGFMCFAIGMARQGASLSVPWASSSVGLFFCGLGLIVWLALCQQLVLQADTILVNMGSIGVVALTVIANLVDFLQKRAVVASGCQPSFLGFLSMGIGVAASLPIRIYAFLKPTVADALLVGLISAGLEVCGQVVNVVKIKMLPKVGFPEEPKTMSCFGYQVYTSMVFEATARVLALLVLLAADTRYFTFAGVGFGFSIDPGLVMINFIVAISVLLVTNTAIMYLLSTKVPEIDLPGILQNRGLRTTIFAFAPLIATVATFPVYVRNACLRCGETYLRSCFD